MEANTLSLEIEQRISRNQSEGIVNTRNRCLALCPPYTG
jgi:hypothetical protein